MAKNPEVRAYISFGNDGDPGDKNIENIRQKAAGFFSCEENALRLLLPNSSILSRNEESNFQAIAKEKGFLKAALEIFPEEDIKESATNFYYKQFAAIDFLFRIRDFRVLLESYRDREKEWLVKMIGDQEGHFGEAVHAVYVTGDPLEAARQYGLGSVKTAYSVAFRTKNSIKRIAETAGEARKSKNPKRVEIFVRMEPYIEGFQPGLEEELSRRFPAISRVESSFDKPYIPYPHWYFIKMIQPEGDPSIIPIDDDHLPPYLESLRALTSDWLGNWLAEIGVNRELVAEVRRKIQTVSSQKAIESMIKGIPVKKKDASSGEKGVRLTNEIFNFFGGILKKEEITEIEERRRAKIEELRALYYGEDSRPRPLNRAARRRMKAVKR